MSINGIREPSTCTRLQQSEGCTSIKHTGVIILTVIAAIGLIAGVLLTLAHQGHDLAGINALAQMVPEQWLYAGLAAAAVASILASVFTAAQIVNHLKPY